MKLGLGEFHKFHDMIMSVRFCLSYEHLKWGFIAFKMISIRIYIVDTLLHVITFMVVQFLAHLY